MVVVMFMVSEPNLVIILVLDGLHRRIQIYQYFCSFNSFVSLYENLIENIRCSFSVTKDVVCELDNYTS